MARTEVLVKNRASNRLTGRFWLVDQIIAGAPMSPEQMYALYDSVRARSEQSSVPYLRLILCDKRKERNLSYGDYHMAEDNPGNTNYYLRYIEHPDMPAMEPLRAVPAQTVPRPRLSVRPQAVVFPPEITDTARAVAGMADAVRAVGWGSTAPASVFTDTITSEHVTMAELQAQYLNTARSTPEDATDAPVVIRPVPLF